MSSEALAISVRGLGKSYTINHDHDRATTLGEAIVRRLRRPVDGGGRTRETFWALRDVDFDVPRGAVVGIVGRNGAGKSTLLKLLSRITAPTTGEINLRGRVASLLEVGTGFHPELTGRENVFLNGAILGMTRREIARKFDEIVAFAEIERFLDTPVKRYSSGMYVRLAFAVAAHLDSQILIVDEVLAVGDANFQKKCLSQLDRVHHEGRTVLIVSHQLQVIQSCASRAMLLERGRLLMEGSPTEVIAAYLGGNAGSYSLEGTVQNGSGEGQFTEIRFLDRHENPVAEIEQGADLVVHIRFRTTETLRQANLAVAVRNGDGIDLFSPAWNDSQPLIENLAPGEHAFAVAIPTRFLRPGPYWFTLCLAKNEVDPVCTITGLEMPAIAPRPGTNSLLESRRIGVVYVPCDWRRLSVVIPGSPPDSVADRGTVLDPVPTS